MSMCIHCVYSAHTLQQNAIVDIHWAVVVGQCARAMATEPLKPNQVGRQALYACSAHMLSV